MKLLLYCVKAKPYLQVNRCVLPTEYDRYILSKEQYYSAFGEPLDKLNGKIVAECDFEVEKIEYKHIHERDKFGILHNESWFEYRGINIGNEEDCDLPNKSCLSVEEIFDYLINKDGYAIHIKNLHIFDEPRELSDYEDEWEYPLEKAPQNMRRCYSTLYSNIEADMPIRIDSYILISIRPEWLCKILNGEKTIEVRKKVLKEML